MGMVRALIFTVLAVAVFAAGVAFADPQGVATDPLYIGVGARPLGMGKAYVAVAEDGDTIFMNPAGLGAINGLKFTSMYANLLDDVNYTVVGGVYPWGPGAVGLGYVKAGVSGIALYPAALPTAEAHFPSPSGMADYHNSVAFLSYGVKLSKVLPLPVKAEKADTFYLFRDISYFLRDMSVGANVKYFSQGGTGSGVKGGQGVDVDLGLLYEPTPYFALGITQQNVFPPSLVGLMVLDSGVQEDIPALTKIGTKFILLGERDSFVKSPYKATLAGDLDLGGRGRISTGHIGIEFWPMDMLALRLGLDQDPKPGGTGAANNYTAGLGLRLHGVEFNYAYHPYAETAGNTTHFFSVAYVGKDEKEKVAEVPVDKITVNPADKFITQDEKVDITGSVLPDITRVEVNGQEVTLDPQGNFSTEVALDQVGKHLVVIKGKDAKGIETKVTRRILRLANFADIDEEFWAREPVLYAATVGLVEGYPDGSFQPQRSLARSELATLLVRAKGGALPTVNADVYKDLKKDHWSARYVKVARDAGLVQGYPDGTFKPNSKITRAEGTQVMVRFEGIKAGRRVNKAPFDDVEPKHWAAPAITAAKDRGLIAYLKDTPDFEPDRELSRAEAVEVLSKTKFAGEKIKDLLDFEKGYSETKKPRKFTGR